MREITTTVDDNNIYLQLIKKINSQGYFPINLMLSDWLERLKQYDEGVFLQQNAVGCKNPYFNLKNVGKTSIGIQRNTIIVI